MTRARIESLQWFGLLAAPAAWAVQVGAGYGLIQTTCSAGGSRTFPRVPLEIALTAAAATVAVLAEAAAGAVYRELRRADDDEPPSARQRFFAIGGLALNPLFFVAVLLGCIASIAQTVCRA
jgi:hypothetical protein